MNTSVEEHDDGLNIVAKGFGFNGILKLVTTKNYKDIAKSCNLKFTGGDANFSHLVFISGCPVMDPHIIFFWYNHYRLETVSHLTHCSKSVLTFSTD
jgi:hypothetical protein